MGELRHLTGSLLYMRNHLTPLAEAMQRVLQYLPESSLAFRGQPERSAFHTVTGNTKQQLYRVLYSTSL